MSNELQCWVNDKPYLWLSSSGEGLGIQMSIEQTGRNKNKMGILNPGGRFPLKVLYADTGKGQSMQRDEAALGCRRES